MRFAAGRLRMHSIGTLASGSRITGRSSKHMAASADIGLLVCRLGQRPYIALQAARQPPLLKRRARTCNAESADLFLTADRESVEPEKGATMSRKQLWFAAIKPPMYTVCIIPVLVSAALAFHQTGVFAAARYWQLTAASIATIAWLNLSNDAFDAEMGVDKAKAESVVNLTGNRTAVLCIANVLLAVALAIFFRLLRIPGDPRPVRMLGTALAMGYMYQGPPFRLSYKGLGEPICLIAFGPLSIGAFYIALAGAGLAAGAPMPPEVWVASTVVGISVSSVLFCSHWHQIDGDRAAGKMSPLVRLGPDRALQVLRATIAVPYLVLGVAAAVGWLPTACLVASAASLPSANNLLSYAARHRASLEDIRPLKKYAIKWHTPLGLALAAGLIFARRSVGA